MRSNLAARFALPDRKITAALHRQVKEHLDRGRYLRWRETRPMSPPVNGCIIATGPATGSIQGWRDDMPKGARTFDKRASS
jgi:hypothetical protein